MPSGVYTRSKENIENLRKNSLGRTPWNKGLKIRLQPLGYKHSAETLAKLKITGKLNGLKKRGIMPKNLKSLHGKKHWNYKDGRTSNKQYRNWQKNLRNRVIKRLNKEGSCHTFGEWELLKKQYNYTCPSCNQSEPNIILTEDHIIPLSKGGSDNIDNIQPLCGHCNAKKHTLIIKY